MARHKIFSFARITPSSFPRFSLSPVHHFCKTLLLLLLFSHYSRCLFGIGVLLKPHRFAVLQPPDVCELCVQLAAGFIEPDSQML